MRECGITVISNTLIYSNLWECGNVVFKRLIQYEIFKCGITKFKFKFNFFAWILLENVKCGIMTWIKVCDQMSKFENYFKAEQFDKCGKMWERKILNFGSAGYYHRNCSTKRECGINNWLNNILLEFSFENAKNYKNWMRDYKQDIFKSGNAGFCVVLHTTSMSNSFPWIIFCLNKLCWILRICFYGAVLHHSTKNVTWEVVEISFRPWIVFMSPVPALIMSKNSSTGFAYL